MKLSTYFSLDEMIASDYAARHGMDNTPPKLELENLTYTAEMLDRVRSLLGVPVLVSSAYRSPAVNAAVGGAKTSQHMLGQAVDFTAPSFGTPQQVANAIRKSHIPFDQLILEYGRWVHLSFVKSNPRGHVLTINLSGTKEGIAG